MLKDEDIIITIGRAEEGGFMTVRHKPAGIARRSQMLKPGKEKQEMCREIEAELIQRGLTQHILPDRSTHGFPLVRGGRPITSEDVARLQAGP